MKQKYKIKGMHCASCAVILEKTFKKIEGVESAEVNYGTEAVRISFDEKMIKPEDLSKKIEPLGYSLLIPDIKEMNMSEDQHAEHLGLSQSKFEKLKELSRMKKNLIIAIPMVAISIFVMIWDILGKFNLVEAMSMSLGGFFNYLLMILSAYILIFIGRPYLLGVYRFFKYGKANMDTLVGLGTSVAFLYSTIIVIFAKDLSSFIDVSHSYFDVTIIVIIFIALGKYLEIKSKLKTGDAIEKLLNLQAKTALVLKNDKEIEIPIEEVIHGDLIIIKPAGKIPVDGIIMEGFSYIDESMITGEAMAVSKKIGDVVVAGTINTNGSFIFKATKIGSETMLASIIKMVENAQGSKAPIQALADKISGIFVPIVLILSFVAFGSWLIIGPQYLGFSQALSYGLISFVGILVIACPCALGLATPTAIIVGVGKGAREGILIKDASTLEKLHKVNVIVVDKTGTLTQGKPELTEIKNVSEKNDDEIISILASLENKSEHPIAQAIINYSKIKNIKIQSVENFEAIKGKGIKGTINGVTYYAGNSNLIESLSLKYDMNLLQKETLKGKTPIILAIKEKILVIVLVADQIKIEAVEAVKNLHSLGIKVVMFTGDNKNTAEYIAKQVNIDEVVAQMMPEDKLNKIKEFQKEGKIVAMAGDGVNDAPALAQADVGIAMATGTDVAIESAGITLLHGDISKLVKSVYLSKITMRGIKQNLFWAFFYNIIGIPLAGGLFYPFFGWMLSPIFAGFAMAMSSVSVVGNSLRIKNKKL